MASVWAVDLDLFHARNGGELCQALTVDTVGNVHFGSY